MLILLALALIAQPTLSVTVPPNVPFQVTFEHDALLMPSFRWWCDGGIVKNFSATETRQPTTAPDANGRYTYTVTVPGLPAGSHACFISAYNENGEAKADPIVFPVGTPAPIGKPPAVPVNIRIVVSGSGGR